MEDYTKKLNKAKEIANKGSIDLNITEATLKKFYLVGKSLFSCGNLNYIAGGNPIYGISTSSLLDLKTPYQPSSQISFHSLILEHQPLDEEILELKLLTEESILYMQLSVDRIFSFSKLLK